MRKLWWIVLMLLLLVSVQSAAAENLYGTPLRQNGWQQITPGGETLCGHGAPYSFFYREGSSNKVLIDFQGGGMCWNGQTCNVSTTTFDDWVDPNNGSDNPGVGTVGIMDLNNPENPFGDYNMLFVSYCTGDMHTGNHEQGYTYENTYFDTKHKGAVNAAAALNWLYATKPAADLVFVTGCSAGAVGAAYWTADIAKHYGGAKTTLFADSGGGWRGIPGETWNAWGTNYQGVTGGNLSVQRFFIGAARQGAKVTEFNSISDGTQNWFTTIGFSGAPYVEALRANLREISASARGFRYFTGDGDWHCLIPRGDFYTYSSNAVRIRDWVANLATRQAVDTVICSSCVG
jgi:hypothetical protein